MCIRDRLMDWNFELRGAQSWICDEDRWDYRDIQVQMPDKEYTFLSLIHI